MLAAIVMVITMTALPVQVTVQDTSVHKDSTPAQPPTLEQIRYMEGLKTVTRGVTQVREGLNRVSRAQQADSLRRRRAARMLGGFWGTARTFIVSGRPKMQASAYTDSLRVLAKQLTTRLDSLTAALPACEKTAGRDPTGVATNLTTRLKNYDDALLAFRTAQTAKPDSGKVTSSQ
jgi:hypothetical protein